MPVQPKHPLDIAIGKSRNEVNWKNKQITWEDFVSRIQNTHRTAETYSEYLASDKTRQDEIKDVGGFVGGHLAGGKRSKTTVTGRQLVTLDIDEAPKDIWETFCLLYDNAAAIYSTHKHSPESPRYRLIIPLDRVVLSDEYIPIARNIAGTLGIDYFDYTTYQPSRLMYWPSTSKDGVYEFEQQDGPWLSADGILNSYNNWRDASEWPVGVKEKEVTQRDIHKQGDPLLKTELIGAFCRAYTIQEAIEAFLPEVYERCDLDDRFTYKLGSTSGGLIVYEDKFAFSHHGTDPVSGKLCNAWDLVREHLFASRDEDSKSSLKGNILPSFKAMVELARDDHRTKMQSVADKLLRAREDFDDTSLEEKDAEWMSQLEVDKKSNFLSSRANFQTILLNDPDLKGCFAVDIFSHRKVLVKDPPWRTITRDTRLLKDEDECDLRIRLSKPPYEMSNNSNLKDAFNSVIDKNTVHPVKDYLQTLRWDGVERVDSLFIDYMGAQDSKYTRAVTRKSLTAAVARIFEPGIKFDHILTLVGEEGKQKSSIFRKLAKDWFSDSFNFKMIEREKQAFENLQGYWIIEIGELAGIRKTAIESVKQFITKSDDVFRIPHATYTSQFKRQCIFFGSTNRWDFLQGSDGNRRFWPVPILVQPAVKNPNRDLTDSIVDQIWAEAQVYYQNGEKLYLPSDIEAEAKEMQRGHTEKDDRTGKVEHYLEQLLPENWEEMGVGERFRFLRGDELAAEGVLQRNRVCVAEIWCECFGEREKDLTTNNTKPLHAIMSNMKGWQKTKQKRFGVYGHQIAYERVITDSKNRLFVTTNGKIDVTT